MPSKSPISEELDLLRELEQRSLLDPLLSQEWMAAARDFPVPVENDQALARFREWFLLERPSQSLGVAPISAWTPDSIDEESGWHRLLDSFMGIFHVANQLRTDAREVLQLTDLWSGRSILVTAESLGELPQEDRDLLAIGRFVCTADELHVPLPGLRFISAPGLADAVETDLALARHQNLRAHLSQLECEKLLPAEPNPGPATESELQALEAKLEHALAASSWDLAQVQDGLNDGGLDQVLNRLAFETKLDLEPLRRLLPEYVRVLLECQSTTAPTMQTNGSQSQGTGTVLEASEALEQFDQVRQSGQSLEDSFAQLESALGLQPGISSEPEMVEMTEPEKVGPHTELGLQGWLKSYLWEADLDELPTGLQALVKSFQRRQLGQIDAQEIRIDQVVAFLMESESGQELDRRFKDSRGFLHWSQHEQGADLSGLLEEWQTSIRPRLHAILEFNLSNQAQGFQWDQNVRLLSKMPLKVATDSKQESAPVDGIDDRLQSLLLPGDLILGSWRRGRYQAGAVLPLEALPPQTKAAADPEIKE
jgi:hypothetical protein